MSKSAQLFLHTWLPDAMEGPTPVSALIHAATMVAAGVFLLARCSVFFVLSTNISMLVVLIGASTAFFAAVVGLFQQDIKKVVAYSTCSQLGYMVVAAGLTTFSFSIFHLVNHAFFKALLFLTSGAIIHSVGDHQDIRRMGGFSALLPFSYVMFLIGSLAICGVPFFSGFYSKDLIIESASVLETQSDYFNGIVYLLMFAAFFTAAYSFRLIYLVFFIDTKVIKILASTIHESSLLIVFPLAILGMCSLFFGFITFDCFSTAPSIVFKNTLFSNYSIFSLDLEYQEYFVKALPLIFTITGYFAAIVLTILNFQMLRFQMLRLFVVFHTKKWMVDINYNFFVAYNTFILSYKIFLLRMEKGLFEFIGPIFVVNLITKIAYKLSIVQSGFIYHYLAYFIFGFVSLVVLFASSILVGFFSSKLIFILIMSLLVSFFLIGSESFDFKQEFKLIFFSKTLQKIIFMFIVWVYPFAFATYSYILAACYLVYVHKYGTMPLVNWFISF
jgi:proton-translocating NADH-quinone oxidoreductase chain L